MAGACGTHGRSKKCVKILLGNEEGRDHLGYLKVDARIILKSTLKF
jgi:hypothetical protein